MAGRRTNLTARQQRAVNSARGPQKAHLAATFRAQLTNTRAARGPARARRGVSTANLARMPRGTHTRAMPDMSKGNWSQSPATSNVLAPRGFGYYDAFEHDPFAVATHMSIGPATPIVGSTVVSEALVTKGPITLGTQYTIDSPPPPGVGLEGGAMLLIVQPACTDVQAVLFFSSTHSDGLHYAEDGCQSVEYRSPQLQADPPDNAIPTRCSLRIRNWTQQMGVGGVVRVLRLTTGLALHSPQTTNGQLALFMEGIRTHTRTRVYGGEELTEVHQKNCTVVDQSKATWFIDWDKVMKTDQTPWAEEQHWGNEYTIDAFTSALHDPAYTPIAILFEPFVAAVSSGVVGNKYEVSVRSQFLAHYAQGTMLANMAIAAPTAPGPLTTHRDREEHKGSTLERIGNTIKNGASWAWNHKGGIIAGLSSFGGPGMRIAGAALGRALGGRGRPPPAAPAFMP